jgi:hypothetical protein
MPVNEGGGIFVSYRRQETSHLAGRLADRLVDRFGEGQVFIDVDTIEPGVDFAEEISRAVAACKVLLAIIGPAWLTASDEQDRRRLDDPDDIVRLEIEAALARKVRVIPILVEGAVMPGREDLPESMAGLARRNALLIRHESFRSDAGRLVTAIERVLAPAPSTTVPKAQQEAAPKAHQEAARGPSFVSTALFNLAASTFLFQTAGATKFWGKILNWACDSLMPWVDENVPNLSELVRDAFLPVDKLAAPSRGTVKTAWQRLRELLQQQVVEFVELTDSTYLLRITSWVRVKPDASDPESGVSKVQTEQVISHSVIPRKVRRELFSKGEKLHRIDVTEARDAELDLI